MCPKTKPNQTKQNKTELVVAYGAIDGSNSSIWKLFVIDNDM